MELKSEGSDSPHSPSIALVGPRPRPRPRPLVLSFSSFDSPVGASRHIGLFCATHGGKGLLCSLKKDIFVCENEKENLYVSV